MRELLEILHAAERRRGMPLALGTLVASRGSSYRQPGARLLIAADGTTVGSLSGGCLEAEVAARAGEVVKTGSPSLMSFDTRARFGCHGAIDVFVERVAGSFFEDLAGALHTRKSCLAATCFAPGPDAGSRIVAQDKLLPPSTFVQRIEPPIRLLLIGHGPDTAALESFAAVLGWQIERAESAAELSGNLDARTAALIGTHHYGRDFVALQALADSPLPYVGLVGSRRRRDQLLCDLIDLGVEYGENFFAPAGLDLGAEAPEQIALAIIAEIQAAFGAGSGGRLRERRTAIHARAASVEAAPPELARAG